MSINAPFSPAYGAAQTIAVTDVSATATILTRYAKQLVLTNLGSQNVYVRVSKTTPVTATVADFVIGFGAGAVAQVAISIPQDVDTVYVAAVTSTGTSSLHVIPGEGFL